MRTSFILICLLCSIGVRAQEQPNSNHIAGALSSLISRLSTEQDAKTKQPASKSKKSKGTQPTPTPKEYTDEEQYRTLYLNADQIEKYLATNLSPVTNTPPATKDDVVLFCKGRRLSKAEKKSGSDVAVIIFLDKQVIGAGTATKGVFTTFPKEKYGAGFHTLSIRVYGKPELVTIPVDFSIKNYFVFEWIEDQKMKVIN